MGHSIKHYNAEELSNLQLGQGGFDILEGAGPHTASSKGIDYWIALKATDGSAPLRAEKFKGVGGDDLAKDGDYSNGSSNDITLEDGDIVYGAFSAVITSSSKYIIAYRGRGNLLILEEVEYLKLFQN